MEFVFFASHESVAAAICGFLLNLMRNAATDHFTWNASFVCVRICVWENHARKIHFTQRLNIIWIIGQVTSLQYYILIDEFKESNISNKIITFRGRNNVILAIK